MGYLKTAILGTAWMGSLRVAMRAGTFIRIFILARILDPADFGVFAIASLVLSFLEVVTETGVNTFLISEKEHIDKFISSAFVVSVARGILISSIMVLASRPVSSFFGSDDSYLLLLFASAIPFIRGLINPSIVKLQKELMFAKEVILRFSVLFVDITTSVVFALLGAGAMSFIVGWLISSTLEVFFSWIFIKPTPSFSFDKSYIVKLFHVGKWVSLAQTFDYLFRELDDIVLGRLLGTVSLGIYQIAYKIGSLPLTELSDIIYKVFFPIYSKLSTKKERLKAIFVKTFLATLSISVPFALVLLFFPSFVVNFFLGEKWNLAIPAIQVLCFFGVFRALSASSFPLFLSIRKQSWVTVTTLSGIVGLAITIYPFVVRFGVVGAAYSALIGAVASFLTSLFFVRKAFQDR